MTASHVIAGLFVAGVTLHLVDGEIRYRAPAGGYGPPQRALVATHRPQITATLTAHGAAAPWRALLGEVATWPEGIQLLLASRATEIEAGANVLRADAEVRAFGEIRDVAHAPVVSVALCAAHGIGAAAFAARCQTLLGRPGPASVEDDATVAGAILRRHGSRPAKATTTGEAAHA